MLNDMMDGWKIYKDDRPPPNGVEIVILVEFDIIKNK
jgi:hypothetical protein